MLLQVVTRHLDTHFEKRGPERIRFTRMSQLRSEAGTLLSTLAAMSHPDDSLAIKAAFDAATRHLQSHFLLEIPFKSGNECALDQIKEALEQMSHSTPLIKRGLIESCSISVMADEGVSSREAELIRAVADAMGCPIRRSCEPQNWCNPTPIFLPFGRDLRYSGTILKLYRPVAKESESSVRRVRL